MAAEGRLFGTDGVRGKANHYPVTPEMAFSLGRAGAEYLQGTHQGKGAIVVGRDPRLSGDMLEAAICAGICAGGVDVVRVGVLPTPAIAYLTRAWGALGGVVLSASHNPFDDNGIKFFSADGFKLPDAQEDQLEQMVRHGATRSCSDWARDWVHSQRGRCHYRISELRLCCCRFWSCRWPDYGWCLTAPMGPPLQWRHSSLNSLAHE